MVRNYIGLGATLHDPAIAIVDSAGEVVFAEAVERHQQSKRAWCCVPDDLIHAPALVRRYCEPGAQLVLARNWSDRMPGILQSFFVSRPAVDAMVGVREAFPWGSTQRALGEQVVEQQARWLAVGIDANLRQAGNNLAWQDRLGTLLSGPGGAPAVRRNYDHHLSHAAAACHASPFADALCAVIDGYGEKAATSFYHYSGGALSPVGPKRKVGLPTSLGVYYLILCWACGFDPYRGEEGKVMGLAPYGRRDPDLYDLLRPLLRVDGLTLKYARDKDRRVGQLLGLRRPAGSDPMAAADLAHTGQLVYEEVCVELLTSLHGLDLSDNLVLSGGCALNSAFNGKIVGQTPFCQLFVPPAPADDGTAVGAALLAYGEDHPSAGAPPGVTSPFLGSDVSAEGLDRLRRFSGYPHRVLSPADVPRAAARLLARGKILGWVQGRAEFGPRALGNRSILADPRSVEIRDRLNAEVKYREAFRPFAPSILHEHGPRYFEDYQASPHMERVLRFRDEVKDRVPGVVHVDGTGRLQSVERQTNERYYDLITEFEVLTGVPLVLNTSFNVMGKPIVHSVEDAVAVFFTSGMDALIIGDTLLEKTTSK